MLRNIGHLLLCGYVRILENVEDFRTLHSDPPSQRYALLRFKKDAPILDIFKNILWHFNTPFTFLDVGAEIGYYRVLQHPNGHAHGLLFIALSPMLVVLTYSC